VDKIRFLFICVSVFGVLFTSCVREDEFPKGDKIQCSAETLNKKGNKFIVEKEESKVLFEGGRLQTDSKAHSGKHSVRTHSKGRFAFGHSIMQTGPDWYFKVSVWRKSKHGNGILVAAADDPSRLYAVSENVYETDKNGWERLELDVFTPSDFSGDRLTFYVWNNTDDTIYFDDFVIERLASKHYPEYNIEQLSIHIDTSAYLKILKKRQDAFKKGVLQSSDDDWVKGILSSHNDIIKAKLRLKGDWLDHLRGEKWSFRIKTKKKYAWNRLRTFSIQTPSARGYLYEWITHQLFDSQDLLTTRYDFISVSLNGKPRGLYAWEEHFEKQLLEWRNRREGPILKFSEDAFWQSTIVSSKRKTNHTLPYYQASVIEPFRQGKTVRSATLLGQYLNAQKLMQQYKTQSAKPSEIFDIDKLAKAYALLDISHARHGRAWHNQRFYYNPVLCKLERIVFDGFGEQMVAIYGINNNVVYKKLTSETLPEEEDALLAFVFTDSVFTNLYLNYLEKFSSQSFIDSALNKMANNISYYDSIIKFEFPFYKFDSDYLSRSAKDIRAYLPELTEVIREYQKTGKKIRIEKREFSDKEIYENTPEFFVNVYKRNTVSDSLYIEIQNYYPRKIIVLGTGSREKYVEFYEHPEPRIPAYTGQIQSLIIATDTASEYLFFMVDGSGETFKTEIYPWPYPEGQTPQQELMSYVNLKNTDFIDRVEGNKIFIKQGDLRIATPIIIPKGYEVYFGPGTRINLIDSAMFLSYSPVFMNGTSSEPIIIESEDFSANGFTVLQADKKSIVKNVEFNNLNTLNYKSWTLTSSVTFYESDVEIEHAKFYRNQCEDALNIVRSNFVLDKSLFNYTFSDAFDSDFSTGIVKNTIFTNIGNDAIDFSGSKITIENTSIVSANDKGISGGEDSHLIIKNVSVERASIGMASKDLSVLEISNSKIVDCDYGLVLLQKKVEYGPATMIINNSRIINSKQEFLIEEGSEIELDGKTIKGKSKNVAEVFY